MAKTLAQKAADRQLTEAVERMVEAYKMVPEGMTLIDFVVVSEHMKMNEDGEIDGEGFAIQFRDGNARSVVAIGLLNKGLELMQFGNVDIEEVD